MWLLLSMTLNWMTASQYPKEGKEVLYTQGQMNDSSERLVVVFKK